MSNNGEQDNEDDGGDDSQYYGEIYNHKYVDLGLSSGTLWARQSIGEYDYEYDTGEEVEYFAWGETEGHNKYDFVDYKAYSWNRYCFTDDDGETMSKYNEEDGMNELMFDDDAAAQNWGGGWRMPTKEQVEELFDECDIEMHEDENGVVFIGPNGSRLNFHYNGHLDGHNYIDDDGDTVTFWTKSLSEENDKKAYVARVPSSLGTYFNKEDRCLGMVIRPVYYEQ